MSEIFRKKSLDRVNAPEDLNQYMRVTNPPVWAALICVLFLLISAVIWSLTASLETTARAVVVKGESGNVCYISADDISAVKVGTKVRIGKTEYRVVSVDYDSSAPAKKLSDYEMSLGGFKDGETVFAVLLDGEPLSSGSQAEVVLEEISSLSFLLGSGN